MNPSRPVDSGISRKIANLGLLAAIVVVVAHMPPAREVGGYKFLHEIFPACLVKPAVCFFFAVSGYLLAGHCGERGWWKAALSRRWRTLVIPYFALNALCALPRILAQLTGLSRPSAEVKAVVFDWRLPFDVFGLIDPAPPDNVALWYVRCLVLLVILSPLLHALVSRSRVRALAFCLLLLCIAETYAILPALGHDLPPWWRRMFSYCLSLDGLAFFTAGMVLRLWDFRLSCGRLSGGLAFAAGVAAMTFFAGCGWCGAALILPARMLIVLGAWALIPPSPWPRELTALAFPIYVLHVPVLHVFCVLLRKFNLMPWVFSFVGFALFWGCCVGVAAACGWMIRRRFPRLTDVLFGGR